MKTKKILALALAAVLLVAVSVAGTIAYLTDSTETVTNTFSPSDVHIDLTETPNNNGAWTAQLIPGKEYAKDPKVIVDDANTSVNLWVFVKVEDNGASTYVDYDIAEGWTELTEGTGIYWREWADNAAVDEWYVLAGTDDNANGAVTVKSELTADELYNASANLKFTAYAIQKEGFDTAAAAWTQITTLKGDDDTNHTH